MTRKIVIQSLRRELKAIKEQIERLQNKSEGLQVTLDHFLTLRDDPDVVAEPSANPAIRVGAYRILQQARKPLHKVAIHELLENLGIPVGGQNPLQNISAHMSLDPRIESLGNGFWGLSEWGRSKERADEPSKARDLIRAGPEVGIGEENLPF